MTELSFIKNLHAVNAGKRLRFCGKVVRSSMPSIIMKQPLTVERLRELIDKLGFPARDVLRRDEPLARGLKLGEGGLSDDELIKIMVENPDLIQRPIVVRGDEAVLCRPPENVKRLL